MSRQQPTNQLGKWQAMRNSIMQNDKFVNLLVINNNKDMTSN